MVAVIDTCILAAFFNPRDERHVDANRLMHRVSSGEFGSVIVTDYVFDETVTLLSARGAEKRKVAEFGDRVLLSAVEFDFVNVTPKVFEGAWKLFKASKGLSFTDCVIVETAKANNARILTFDRGFARIGGLKIVS